MKRKIGTSNCHPITSIAMLAGYIYNITFEFLNNTEESNSSYLTAANSLNRKSSKQYGLN